MVIEDSNVWLGVNRFTLSYEFEDDKGKGWIRR